MGINAIGGSSLPINHNSGGNAELLTHRVSGRETPESIAENNGVTLEELRAANPQLYSNTGPLVPGQTLTIPPVSAHPGTRSYVLGMGNNLLMSDLSPQAKAQAEQIQQQAHTHSVAAASGWHARPLSTPQQPVAAPVSPQLQRGSPIAVGANTAQPHTPIANNAPMSSAPVRNNPTGVDPKIVAAEDRIAVADQGYATRKADEKLNALANQGPTGRPFNSRSAIPDPVALRPGEWATEPDSGARIGSTSRDTVYPKDSHDAYQLELDRQAVYDAKADYINKNYPHLPIDDKYALLFSAKRVEDIPVLMAKVGNPSQWQSGTNKPEPISPNNANSVLAKHRPDPNVNQRANRFSNLPISQSQSPFQQALLNANGGDAPIVSRPSGQLIAQLIDAGRLQGSFIR
jgi:LysM domain